MIGAQLNVEGALMRGTAICEGAQVAAARILVAYLTKPPLVPSQFPRGQATFTSRWLPWLAGDSFPSWRRS